VETWLEGFEEAFARAALPSRGEYIVVVITCWEHASSTCRGELHCQEGCNGRDITHAMNQTWLLL
jgi:hypothetical protein